MQKKTHKIQLQAARYSMINVQLYKRSFRGFYLRRLIEKKMPNMSQMNYMKECATITLRNGHWLTKRIPNYTISPL